MNPGGNPIRTRSLSPIPGRTPMIDSDGMITSQWFMWFMIELYRRVGGGYCSTLDELELLVNTLPDGGNVDARIAGAVDQLITTLDRGHDAAVFELQSKVDQLQAMVNSLQGQIQSIALESDCKTQIINEYVDASVSGLATFQYVKDYVTAGLSGYATQAWVSSNFLSIGGTAYDSNRLGGTIASSYALQSWVTSNFLGITATAVDSSSLGGVAAASYATQSWVTSNFVPMSLTSLSISGNQVLTSRQTGVGTSLTSRTAAATYGSTEQTMLQEAHDKVRLIESKLKTHGMIAT